jgi:hypothetical protein
MVLLTPSGGGFSIGASAASSDNNMEKSLGKLIDENYIMIGHSILCNDEETPLVECPWNPTCRFRIQGHDHDMILFRPFLIPLFRFFLHQQTI